MPDAVAAEEPDPRLEETSRAILSFSGPSPLLPLLQAVVDAACRLARAEFGALGIVVRPDLPMDPWVFSGVDPAVAGRIGRYPRPIGVLADVALGGRAARVRDVRRHPAFRGFPEHHPVVTSVLGVPIRFEGRNMGVLYLGNRRGDEEFTADDQHVIELLAAHAGAAVAQARLRDEIARDRARLEAILTHAPHGIVFHGSDGAVLANPAAERIVGRVPAGGPDAWRALLARADGEPFRPEEWPPVGPTEACVCAGDRRVPVRFHAIGLAGPDGTAGGTLVVLEDVSAFKELERMRERFAGMVAHDLRNPVSTIRLATGQLLRTVSGDSVTAPVDLVRRMHRASGRLAEMVSDLVDVARIELQAVRLSLEAVSLPEAVRSLVEEIAPGLGPHPVTVRVVGEPVSVRADPVRLDQIVTNLVDNAAKYSPDGAPIAVTVSTAAGGAEVAVTDAGPGLEPQAVATLFARFRVAGGESKTGLGLGLYIAKGLVDAHGGRLRVESTPGRGSTFRVWLPAASG